MGTIIFGIDVARSGEDKTVIAVRRGNTIVELIKRAGLDTMEVTGRIVSLWKRWEPEYAIIDVIGIGAGVVDRLREQGYNVIPFNASERTNATDFSGELGFINKRAAAWWNLREMLDPGNDYKVGLPRDDELTGDLTAPHWKVTSSGRIQVESKADIKKRLGRSTDAGDAVVMAFFKEPSPRVRWV